MNSITTRIKLLLITILIVLLSSCSTTPNYETLADTLHSFTTAESVDVTLDKSGKQFKTDAGIYSEKGDADSLKELMINDEFFEVYIEKYGLYDLLKHYNGYLSCAISSDDESVDDSYKEELNSRDGQIRGDLTSLPEYLDLESFVINAAELEKLHGSNGYYAGKKDVVNEGEKIKGEFNDAKNDNAVYESSRTNKSEKKYYGDWEVDYSVKYNYDPGKYGWNNGVFEDESPNWEENSTLNIYYKGELFASYKNVSPDYFEIECKMVDGNCFYWEDLEGENSIHWVKSFNPAEAAKDNNDKDKQASEANDSDENQISLGINGIDDGESAQAQFEEQGETATILTKGIYILDIGNQSLIDGGLEIGDLIISLNGEKVYTWDDLDKIVDKYNPGDDAILVVSRNHEEKTVKGQFITKSERLDSKSGIDQLKINGRNFEFDYDNGVLTLKE